MAELQRKLATAEARLKARYRPRLDQQAIGDGHTREGDNVNPLPELTAALEPELRLRFYERLAQELTIVVRGIWSDETFTDSEKVECMKWVNEIQHRVTAKIVVLRRNLHEWTEEDTWSDIQHWVSLAKRIEPDVAGAIRRSYDSAISKI